jgi:hypothetical protein
MLTMYFCYDGKNPVIRCWPAIPRIGDTVALSELDDVSGLFEVTDVVWEGEDEPALSIYIRQSKLEQHRGGRGSTRPTPCDGHPNHGS